MVASDGSGNAVGREPWEQELFARHRWGRHGSQAFAEHLRLRRLWEAARPLDDASARVLDQILSLEICNWCLEESILALCSAVGAKRPADRPIGHLASLSCQRWRDLWAYYLSLRDWLPSQGQSGSAALLETCDPDGSTRRHVASLLGERTDLKDLYVERLCLCLQHWLAGIHPPGSGGALAHSAAVAALEAAITQRDPDGRILAAMRMEGDGKLQPCHHKAFRRYDIILSSIGTGAWRAGMPERGTDGAERAEALRHYLVPIAAWADGKPEPAPAPDTTHQVYTLLGERDPTRVFLASLLASLLRAQQRTAGQWADRRGA